MKKFLAALIAAFLVSVSGLSYAANTATGQTALPIRIGGASPVKPYVLAFDTVDTDLTVVTPATGKMACVVGALMSETSATNVTFKSGTTTYAVPELAANQGFYDQIDNGAIFCTQPGEALKIQVSAAVSNLLLYVLQASYLDFSGR